MGERLLLEIHESTELCQHLGHKNVRICNRACNITNLTEVPIFFLQYSLRKRHPREQLTKTSKLEIDVFKFLYLSRTEVPHSALSDEKSVHLGFLSLSIGFFPTAS